MIPEFNTEQNTSTADGGPCFYASNSTFPCVEVENDTILLHIPAMIAGLQYDFEFQGRQMFAIKDSSGAINVYEIRSWWRDVLDILRWLFCGNDKHSQKTGKAS